MASEEGVPVDLYIYDLSNGIASLLSAAFIGEKVEGIWHSSIVVYEREYFFGGAGVTSCAPGSTQLGAPHQMQRLGETFLPYQVFVDYIQGLATSSYTGASYNLLEHNCNHFTEEVAQFLCGAHIPKHVLRQADHLPAPLRAALPRLLDSATSAGQAVYSNGARRVRQESPDYLTLNNQIEQARQTSHELDQSRRTLAEKLARKERKKEKKRKKEMRERGGGEGDGDRDGDMAEVEAAVPSEEVSRAGPSSETLDELQADERRRDELKKKNREPPIVYKDFDGAAEFLKLSSALEGVELDSTEKQSLEELQQYLVQGEGSWVLGDYFLQFIGRLLSAPELQRACVPALRCVCAMALREDVSLLLHQDRAQHALANAAHSIDTRPLEEQLPLATLMCNLFENISSSEWLLYISEWEHNGQPLSNIRATTKVAVHALLSESMEMREIGTALLYNIATKERFQVGKALRLRLPKHAKSKVFDDVCVELAMAVLQLLQAAPAEEHLHRALTALARLVVHSSDVPMLIAMVGPNPEAFRGTSPRIDEQLDLIKKKVK